MSRLKISVLVTTYARRSYLEKCLQSLLSQSRPPDEIVLVTRTGDEETEQYVSGLLAGHEGPVEFRWGKVSEPGVMAANRVGLPLVSGEILCYIDDDAVAHPDWIERIERRFEEAADLGAVGGRDVQQTSNGVPDDLVKAVGRVHWYGKITGQHHLRSPGYREVEAIKGCNMAFRRALLTGFDDRIIGNGYFYEVDLCFAVRQAGYKVKYDGDLLVDHYIEAPRTLPGNSDPAEPLRFFYMNHNTVYVMLKNLPFARRVVFLAFTLLWDALATPARLLAGNPAGLPKVVAATYRGKLSGLSAYFSRRGGRSGPTPPS